MASKVITQPHRISFSRLKDKEGPQWDVVNLEPDDLGQETQATVNIAPRKRERSSSAGTTSKPIPGTLGEFTASITMIADYWSVIGRVLGTWNDAQYATPDANAGNIVGGATNDMCDDGVPVRVVIQGICDDGSTANVELPRCYPSIDDDIEIGSSDTQELTIQLNPQIYNPTTMEEDGYPQYSYKFGDADVSENKHYNAKTGQYDKVAGDGA